MLKTIKHLTELKPGCYPLDEEAMIKVIRVASTMNKADEDHLYLISRSKNTLTKVRKS